MELIKKSIHMNRLKNRIQAQITLDDDFIVPDTKSDISTVITSEGEVSIDYVGVGDGKVNVRGRLIFRLLYMCGDGEKRLDNMAGELSFDENMLLEGVSEGDNVYVKWDIEDLTVGIINTRKISAKSVVTLEVTSENVYSMDVISDVEKSDKDSVDYIKKNIDVSQIAVSKRDVIRVRKELEIPSNRGNIQNVLWSTVRLKNTSVKLMEGRLLASGEISVVALYDGEENSMIQWMETTVPFSEGLDLSCSEDMIPDVDISISSANLAPKPDIDGELRLIELDMSIDLGIKIYREESIDFINDMYSTCCDLVPSTRRITYNVIQFKNISKAKVSDRLKLDNESGNVLQVFGSDGVVKVDDVKIIEAENKVVVEGVVYVNIMYISSNDQRPVCVAKQIIPFSHEALVSGVSGDSMIFIRPSIEQLTTVMVGNNEIEAKALVVLDILAIDSCEADIIEEVKEMPFDMEKLKAIPSMAGYMVKQGDTLWKIAKKYYTTVENIKNINELSGNEIREGQMLLVVKEGM
ncbi:MAG: DUF3794 domain-containing protein [Lachnospiraceae bacterium]|nr:DUF3794 domain-containing protein [Lachnospiraceae bacterium]